MDKVQAEKVWERFVQILGEQTFDSKELAEGKRVRNFFGSVESHKKAFDQAVREVTGA